MSTVETAGTDRPERGRSLWSDARDRLLGNRAAVASLVFLALVAMAAMFGPMLYPNAYDRVFSDFVKVPPSLAAYPQPGQTADIARKTASRMRADVAAIEPTQDGLRITLVGRRPLDERLSAYFDRSDVFADTSIIDRTDDGRSLVVDTHVESHRFPFGTDANGRDLVARTLVACRISLAIGCLASVVALVIGVAWGAAAGYAGGRVDNVMMRVVDMLYALPFIFFVIMLVVFLGRNLVLMFLAVGAVEWLDMARIVRGQTLSIKRREFVLAAEALGVGAAGIVRRHVIPNTSGPVVVYLTLMVPKVILLESFLSFLGLGVQEPMTSLGVLISEGAKNIQGDTYLLIVPSIVLVGTLLALNFLGDGLRDALDPRDR